MKSVSGHVCHSPQYPPSAVHVSDSRDTSTGGGCSVSGLAGEVNVHVSAVPLAQQSHSENMCHSGGGSDPNSPMVTITNLVSTPASTLCGSSSVLSIPATGTEVHLGRKVVPSARMDAVMQHYIASGFSEEVSRFAAVPRRPSTNRMYDDQWLCFTHWAAGQEFDLLSPTAAQITTFLYSLFDTHGLSPQSIKGYRTCLASVLNPYRQG